MYWVVAYYKLVEIEEPQREVLLHKQFLSCRDVRGRIYISSQGINGQMSGSQGAVEEYQEWLCSDSRFQDVEFKVHPWAEHCFPRLTIKWREQLVALDAEVKMENRGQHLSPLEWKKFFEKRDENTLILDVRNAYEWEVGHFEGAELPKLDQFRDFPAYAKQLREQRDPQKTKILMYCTGGIRCEFYSALLKEEGFENTYQLQGGVIKYGLEVGAEHWKGKLFVFDDRLACDVAPSQACDEVISHCQYCDALSDLYFNCANMDCNELFLSCQPCALKSRGCCCAECEVAPRVRAFKPEARPKPFRRLSHDSSS